MQMSDSCQKRKSSHDAESAEGGYTLLEILVVLTLVGLITAFSLPQFSVIRDRLEFSLNRESFEQELNGLGYRALKEGRPLVLYGQYPRRSSDDQASLESDHSGKSDLIFIEPGQFRAFKPTISTDANVTLPPAWSLSVDNPIIYQASGFCAGGTVKLEVGDFEQIYKLRAPACHAEIAN